MPTSTAMADSLTRPPRQPTPRPAGRCDAPAAARHNTVVLNSIPRTAVGSSRHRYAPRIRPWATPIARISAPGRVRCNSARHMPSYESARRRRSRQRPAAGRCRPQETVTQGDERHGRGWIVGESQKNLTWTDHGRALRFVAVNVLSSLHSTTGLVSFEVLEDRRSFDRVRSRRGLNPSRRRLACPGS